MWSFSSHLEIRGITIPVLKSLRIRMRNVLKDPFSPIDSVYGIRCAASLAYHRLLRSVEYLGLYDIDLSSVPTKHLSSLVSCVTETVKIQGVRGLDLVNLFQSIKSQKLQIFNQRLGTEETQAHVSRSKTNVKHGHRSSQLYLMLLFTNFVLRPD